MRLSKRFSLGIVAAVALAIVAVPSVALAGPGPNDAPGPNPQPPGQLGPAAKGKHRPKAKRQRPRFPMAGKQFVDLVNRRLHKAGSRLDQAMKKRGVPPQLQAEIKADFAKASNTIRQAAHRAAADGKVTRQEANKVRQLAKRIRQQARKKYGPKVRGAKRANASGPRGQVNS